MDTNFLLGNLKRGDPLGNLALSGRIMLKRISEKQDLEVVTAFSHELHDRAQQKAFVKTILDLWAPKIIRFLAK
jgi:hypothetical protein